MIFNKNTVYDSDLIIIKSNKKGFLETIKKIGKTKLKILLQNNQCKFVDGLK